MGTAWSLPAALVLGLISSVHCLGMCGGFSVALVAGSQGGPLRRGGRVLSYHAGRLFSYAFLGAIAGHGGARLGGFTGSQHAVILLAGIVTVAVGVELSGIVRPFTGAWLRPLRAIAGWMRIFLARRGWSAPFLAGLANGVLPCGAVIAALALAAAEAGTVPGIAVMLLFGAGTLPALLLLAFAATRLPPRPSHAAVRLAGWLVIAFGGLTIVRAGGWFHSGETCCGGQQAAIVDEDTQAIRSDKKQPHLAPMEKLWETAAPPTMRAGRRGAATGHDVLRRGRGRLDAKGPKPHRDRHRTTGDLRPPVPPLADHVPRRRARPKNRRVHQVPDLHGARPPVRLLTQGSVAESAFDAAIPRGAPASGNQTWK
jgi:hypothetical protein